MFFDFYDKWQIPDTQLDSWLYTISEANSNLMNSRGIYWKPIMWRPFVFILLMLYVCFWSKENLRMRNQRKKLFKGKHYPVQAPPPFFMENTIKVISISLIQLVYILLLLPLKCWQMSMSFSLKQLCKGIMLFFYPYNQPERN